MALILRSGGYGLVVEPSSCPQEAWLLIAHLSAFQAFTLVVADHVVARSRIRRVSSNSPDFHLPVTW